MSDIVLICPLCGFQFDPTDQSSCPACPLDKGCIMVCCPNCRYSMVDTNKSRIAKIVNSFLNREKQNQ